MRLESIISSQLLNFKPAVSFCLKSNLYLNFALIEFELDSDICLIKVQFGKRLTGVADCAGTSVQQKMSRHIEARRVHI